MARVARVEYIYKWCGDAISVCVAHGYDCFHFTTQSAAKHGNYQIESFQINLQI